MGDHLVTPGTVYQKYSSVNNNSWAIFSNLQTGIQV